MKAYHVLLVDDDPFILEGIGEGLETRGYRVSRADSGERGLELLSSSSFDLIITDLVMGGADGVQLLKRSKEIDATVMVIILTGYGDMLSAIEAIRSKADDYMLKPCEPSELFFRAERCFQKLELTRRLASYQRILPVCCVCKSIRDDIGKEPGTGAWVSAEKFLHERAKAIVTSSYCPECSQKALQEFTKS
jgi:DNA-binding response OmpR family regulator